MGALALEAIAWLAENAGPFGTAEPGHGCEDLQPFLEMVGDSRLVALGEATHGTHEFFAMKHRLAECLVSEKGFTLFAMEAGWAEAEHINAWVQGGEVENPAGRLRYFIDTTFNYPTMAEAYRVAALNGLNRLA